jgi:hypothetical protein
MVALLPEPRYRDWLHELFKVSAQIFVRYQKLFVEPLGSMHDFKSFIGFN